MSESKEPWAEAQTDRVERTGPDLSERIQEKRDYARSIAAEQAPEVVRCLEEELREKREFNNAAAAERAPEVIHIAADYDKYVDYGNEARSPEVHEITNHLYPLHDARPSQDTRPEEASIEPGLECNTEKKPGRILGMRKLTFWLFVIIGVILIAAGTVGGILGGILSSRNREESTKSPSASDSSAKTNSPTAAQTSNISSTETPSAEPTRIDYREYISYNFTVWEEVDFKGRWQYIDQAGYFQFGFEAKSWYWNRGIFVDRKMCSLAYCDGTDWVGYRGGNSYAMTKYNFTRYPDHAKIVCGAVFNDPGCVPESVTTTMAVYPNSLSPPTPSTTGTLDSEGINTLEGREIVAPRTRLR